jgi:hypothetical protein
MATLLAFWVDIVPKAPVAAVTAAPTNAVVATCVVLVPGDAVGAIGVPVIVGEEMVGVVIVGEVRCVFCSLKLAPSDHTVTVAPAGIATPTPAAVVLPRMVEL